YLGDVVRKPRDQRTGVVLIDIFEGKLLDLPEHVFPQIVRESGGRLDGKIGSAHTSCHHYERCYDHCYAHHDDVTDAPAFTYPLVDDVLQQEGHHHFADNLDYH